MHFRNRQPVANLGDSPIIDEHQSRWTDTDRQLMRRALNLAKRGVGQVSPSPLVGCVIADSLGEIFGEGAYLYDGIKHAETLALEEAGPRATGTTAYVN